MRSKFLPLVVALVFGSIAAVGFSKMNTTSPQAPSVEVYVAARVINPAEEITQDAVKLERWPVDKVPEDAPQHWDQLKGKFSAQRIFDGEVILERKLMDSKDTKTISIPKWYNVVTLKSDESSSVANLVAPGDCVNVIGFFEKSEVIPATTTRTVLSGIKVFAVNGRTSRDEESETSNPSQGTVSLLIHNGDAEALTWARQRAKISLTLGRPDEGTPISDEDPGPNPAGQSFLTWLREYQQSKLLKQQQDAAESQQLFAAAAAAAAPVPAAEPAAPAPQPEPQPSEPKIQHQMVKIGPDGQMSIYVWEEGNPVPRIRGVDAAPQNETLPTTVPAPVNDLSYLNGEQSPLYSDPATDGVTGAKDYDPFEGMRGNGQ